MAAHVDVFRITIHEANGLPRPSRLGGTSVYAQIRVDEQKCAKSSTVNLGSTTKLNFEAEVSCPEGSKLVHLEVKRCGLMGKATVLGGCALEVDEIQEISSQSMPIWDPITRNEVGSLLVSIVNKESAQAAGGGQRLPGGLVNQATTTTFTSEQSGPGSAAPTLLTDGTRSRATASSTIAPQSPRSPTSRSLINHASTAGSGLINHAPTGNLDITGSQGLEGGSLQNQASADTAGTRQNALPRAQELLEALKIFSPIDEDHVRKLRQAVEELRHASEATLRTGSGKAIFDLCCTYIEVLFQACLLRSDEKGANGALWLAGRLPSMGDDGEARARLQESLRSQWDKVKMDQALEESKGLLPRASSSSEELGKMMDMLDLAEFHATQVQGADIRKAVGEILASLRPQLRTHLESLLKNGSLDDAEDFFEVLGAARIDALKLKELQKELQQQRSLMLLRRALVLSPGEIGFSVLRERQLRHAIMATRTAMAEDATGAMTTAVKNLLLKEVLPTTLKHSQPQTAAEATAAVMSSVHTLRISFEEVWAMMQRPFEEAPAETKTRLARALPAMCKEWETTPPAWLLTPEQAQCKKAIRQALQSDKAVELQAALNQVKSTPGAREASQTEWQQALERLRDQKRLPKGWDVESMLTGQAQQRNLLAKHELSSGGMLQLFDALLKSTTHEVWTRDRHGKVPKSYTAVRAIEVRNAENWSTYVKRRDEIAKACAQPGSGSMWNDARDGSLMTHGPFGRIAEKTNAPSLLKEANEVWLLHGTSHHAAEAISSQDFDVTRASPTGLFGAGIYFAESISKSDEYVMGKRVDGKELFPLLICRVCLGNMYYCDEKAPDRKRLEERCIKDNWHSVLGDRKKINGTFREFVVYDNLQAFPAYLVYYTREY